MRRGFLLFCLAMSAWAADAPSWLKELQTAAVGKYPDSTGAVVLWNEERVTLEETGRRQTTYRYAVRVLTTNGRKEAAKGVSFDNKYSKVTDAKAWLIYSGGKVKEFSKKDAIESSASSYELYSNRKAVVLSASSEADPGSVFGAELTIEERTIFSQFEFSFQDDLPHLLSRFQLTVPNGWRAEARAYQNAKAEPQVNGTTYVWEARNLTPIEHEPSGLGLKALTPRIAVSVYPPTGTTLSPEQMVIFRDWKDVAAWNTTVVESQVTPTAAVEAKAKALAAGRDAPLDRIRALGAFVQDIRYVAISKETAMGGGYIPHAAEEILTKAYGDCKDKANLLRSMLRVHGISAYPVSIYSGNSRYTKEDWPSPHPFNHEIIAISVPEETKLPAALTVSGVGRLVLFDPTDPYVPFGYLPDHEQGANALLIAGEKGSLFKTPEVEPQVNHTERTWTMKLNADGSLEGQLKEVARGQDAFDREEQKQRLDADQLRRSLVAWLNYTIPGVEVSNTEGKYDAANSTYELRLTFKAPSYARVMQGRLWMVKSGPTSYGGVPNVAKAKRQHPLVIKPASFSEKIVWEVPAHLKLDELPDKDQLESSFGSFSSQWVANAGQVTVERSLTLKAAVIAPEQYGPARDFLSRFHGSEVAPIVFMAK